MLPPLVSIISPLYNKGPYVEHMVLSVLQQSVNRWELIVVDNKSTDDGPDLVRAISDPRCRLVECRRRGVSAARNKGLALAHGEWVLFLDADDLLEPSHLSALLEAAEKNPSCSVVAGGWAEFNDNAPQRRILRDPIGARTSQGILTDSAISHVPWVVHAAMVRRFVLTDEMLWAEGLESNVSEDSVFWFRLVLSTQVAFCSNYGALYRIDTPSSRNHRDSSIQGNYSALQANWDFLEKRGMEATAGQIEAAMRLSEDLHIAARRRKDTRQADRFLKEAGRWLRRRLENKSDQSLSVVTRRVLGLRVFVRLLPFLRGTKKCISPLIRKSLIPPGGGRTGILGDDRQ